MFGWLKGEEPEVQPKLSPLTPEFIESEHGIYVQMLNAALKDERIQNIALTGNYGVGKSSILKQLAKLHKKKVLELSLSTLAPIARIKDDGLPPQATSPTNTIQQEIVKQLLYREKPRKTPGSRFRRIEKFHLMRESALSILLGMILATTFLLTGWTSKIALEFPMLKLGTSWPHAAVLGLGTVVFFLMRFTLYGRLNIKEVSAGAATVTLDEKSVSYFDQYLDEIVYFFEISKRTIVVFEDIDRFNDAHIFETLRSLNALLNGSPQIKERIYFIYAIKDSIFDHLTIANVGREFDHDLKAGDDPAEAEVVRANRTKFFDLVIPVVPFITHQNARNLVSQLLEGMSHDIDLDLIDLASRYVPDMRLLKNVRNEFLIFRERIVAADRGSLNLRETELFAMMLYKSTHLSDFEAIRLGKSNLDKIYAKSRTAVASNLRRLQRELFVLQREELADQSIGTRSAELGARLIAHVKVAVKSCGRDFARASFNVGGAPFTNDELQTSKFWRSFITAEDDPTLSVVISRAGYHENQATLQFSRSDLGGILGPFDAKGWKKIDVEKNLEARGELREQMRSVRKADFKELMARDDWTISGASDDQGLDNEAREIFGTGLAYQVLRTGYINRNFTLYTAIFYGDRISSAATNYVIHHIERDSADENFPLTSSDVEAIIRERGSQFGEPAFYNVDILDHVLKARAKDRISDMMINSIAKLDKEQRNFLDTYLKRGLEASSFVERVTKVAPRIFTYLASELEVEHAERLKLFSAALGSINSKLNYAVDTGLGGFIAENYAGFEVVSKDEIEDRNLDEIAGLAEKAGAVLKSLAPLSVAARKAFVAKDLYEITLENLRIALNEPAELSLDFIREESTRIYAYVTSQLPVYLSCIDGASPSISHQAASAQVVTDVASADARTVERLLKLAAVECILDDLEEVPVECWSLLAKEARFKASLNNVNIYIKERGQVDQSLAVTLRKSGVISETGKRGELQDEKKAVAAALLPAREILSPSERARLCASLQLQFYIKPEELDAEEGDFFAELLAKGVVQDILPMYQRLQEMKWQTKEKFIGASRKFAEYVTPESVGRDLESLLRSSLVAEPVKEVVMANAAAYADASDRKGLLQLGKYSADRGGRLEFEMVSRLAQEKLESDAVLKILATILDDLTEPQVSSVLRDLDGEFASLTELGKDRPKLPSTPNIIAVLEFLKKNGVVNSYSEEKNYLRVNKRHK